MFVHDFLPEMNKSSCSLKNSRKKSKGVEQRETIAITHVYLISGNLQEIFFPNELAIWAKMVNKVR